MVKFLKRILQNRLAFFGGVTIIVLVIIVIFAPWIAPHDPLENNTRFRFEKPLQTQYVLGTDEMGRDILSRIIFGGRVSLLVALQATVLALLFGSIPAIFAGYYGGHVETVVMRIVDVLFAIPSLVLALSIVGIVGRSMIGVAVALGLGYSPIFARVTYSAVLSIRERGYVEASKALGANTIKILLKDIIPNIVPVLMVQSTAAISWAILAEAGLGFIGLGVNPPTPSWGLMLSKAREYMFTEPWMTVSPGVIILITVFAFNLFGDGLRDLLDPRAWQAGD